MAEAVEPKYEGYWRASYDEESELPWPTPEKNWAGRAAFLHSLDRVEVDAKRVAYRGFSICRVCRCSNGNEDLRLSEWVWPAGYRHYVVDHDVRPSTDFEAFILGMSRKKFERIVIILLLVFGLCSLAVALIVLRYIVLFVSATTTDNLWIRRNARWPRGIGPTHWRAPSRGYRGSPVVFKRSGLRRARCER